VTLTKDEIEKALPPALRGNVDEDFVDLVNDVNSDPEIAKIMRENFLSYVNVLRDGKFKARDYVAAVKYVSYKLMEYTNQEAYARTFPDRYNKLLVNGASDKAISSYVSIYNKGKLVNLIMEQTLIPSWVLNQQVYQEAINTQAQLMVNAKSEMVRMQAANSILTHLKKPEKQEVELSLGVKEHSGLSDLKNMLTDLAERQKTLIESGAPTKTIAHQSLIDVTPLEERDESLVEGQATEVEQ
jgi:hypothetical protein